MTSWPMKTLTLGLLVLFSSSCLSKSPASGGYNGSGDGDAGADATQEGDTEADAGWGSDAGEDVGQVGDADLPYDSSVPRDDAGEVFDGGTPPDGGWEGVPCEGTTARCDNGRVVRCVEGSYQVEFACAAACIESEEGAQCTCSHSEQCPQSHNCIDGICTPGLCRIGDTWCEENDLVVCVDGDSVEGFTCDPQVCLEGECLCTGDGQCEDGEFCNQATGNCAPQVCQPDTLECYYDQLRLCKPNGSGFDHHRLCVPGNCADGVCVCTGEVDCFVGEECLDGECICHSMIFCGDDSECCPQGEVCQWREVCVEGVCHMEDRCVIQCDHGERCGDRGELCCSGDTPICGIEGVCIPDCQGQGLALCGESFDLCCAPDQLCIYGRCTEPGDWCDSFIDCDFEEYCEPAIARCLPDQFPEDIQCQEEVEFDLFEIEEYWHWAGHTIGNRHFANVQSIPVTANMTGQDGPEIVITAYAGDAQHDAVLFVLDARAKEVIYYNNQRKFSGQGHIAVADLDGDGYPEMVLTAGDGDRGVYAVDDIVNCPDPAAGPDNCILWQVQSGTLRDRIGGAAPLIADINGDGFPEIVMGSMVIDRDGNVVADGTLNSRAQNGLDNWNSAVVADLDGSGTLELLTGDCAWKVNFEHNRLDQFWCNSGFRNGFPAVADIVQTDGRAGMPEVAVIRSGSMRILAGDTGQTLFTIPLPGGGDGGPPNIADFDGDGTVEIGLAGRTCYVVFDLDCLDGSGQPGACNRPVFPDCTPGVDCLVEPCNALSGGTGQGVLWAIQVKDASMSTGSSVFDFQGDGRNEVVYNDECRLHVLDGQTGQPYLARLNTTRTATEYPMVVDATGDGRSNLLVIANNDQYSRDCSMLLSRTDSHRRPDYFPECFPEGGGARPAYCDEGTQGVYIFEDVNGRWVGTRSIWNQHAYHITNINDDGSVPSHHENHWERFNTFRANRQGDVPLNAANPVVDAFRVSVINCPPELSFDARIGNLGTKSIPAGMPISLYRMGADEPRLIETVLTTTIITPGGSAAVNFLYDIPGEDIFDELDFLIVANDDGLGESFIFDCRPDTATALVQNVNCWHY